MGLRNILHLAAGIPKVFSMVRLALDNLKLNILYLSDKFLGAACGSPYIVFISTSSM